MRPLKFPPGNLRVPMPRVLPVTMLAMAALLAVKSVALVRAAAPAAATEASAPAATPAPVEPVATAPPKPAEMKSEAAKPAAPAAETAKVAAPAELPIPDSERALLLDLRKRRDELDQREAALAARESVLAAAEARLTARLAELGGLQKRLESLDTARKEHDDANWRGLVKLYESMKPKDAATIFNDLDLPVLLPVLDRMKESKAAPVLAAMLPERARLVTAELAQMRARANSVPPVVPTAAGTPAQTMPAGKTSDGG
jgi:flagellar motility protein MotE (MotC chaperone)